MQRKKVNYYRGKKIFKKVANRTQKDNLPGQHLMMRGGFHR